MIPCTHRPPCPGCPRYGEADIAAPTRTAIESLLRERNPALLPLHVVRGKDLGFRHRARLAVRGRVNSPKIGIFETGTHRVVDIPRCTIHHPLVNEVAQEIRQSLRATSTPPYSDGAHLGLVRYAQIVVERRTRTAQVVIVANDARPDTSYPLLDAVRDRLGPRLQGLFWNGNTERTNAILGSEFHRTAGSEAIEESIGGARVFYPPGAFGQSHLELSDSVVSLVHSWIPDGARVLELYAGTGAIGLGLVARSSRVTFNEISSESLRGLDMGLKALPAEWRPRCDTVGGPAEDAASLVATHDVVVADPPRKGLAPEVRDALRDTPPSRFIYVACGLPAFLADAAHLLHGSPLELRQLAAFDLFPFTEHVEIAALFERRDR